MRGTVKSELVWFVFVFVLLCCFFFPERWNYLCALSRNQDGYKYPSDHGEIFWDICLDSCSHWENGSKAPLLGGKKRWEDIPWFLPTPPLALENVKHEHSKTSKSTKRKAQSQVRLVAHLFSIYFFKKNAGWTVVLILLCSAGVLLWGQVFPLPGRREGNEAVGPPSLPAPQLGEGRKSLSSSCTWWAEVWLLITCVTLRPMDHETVPTKLPVSAASADFGSWL